MVLKNAVVFHAPKSEGAAAFASQLARELERAGVATAVQDAWSEEPFPELDKAGLVCCIGGDGTVLRSARRVVPRGIPLFGVNMGRLGFLTDMSPRDCFNNVETDRGGGLAAGGADHGALRRAGPCRAELRGARAERHRGEPEPPGAAGVCGCADRWGPAGELPLRRDHRGDADREHGVFAERGRANPGADGAPPGDDACLGAPGAGAKPGAAAGLGRRTGSDE
ncbi:MAG: NAD(+)/NADH kinase [Dehalococcoidia bacterium]|nr:NAD(+)/NADH kinase [Dehalococcoidia bacterium]